MAFPTIVGVISDHVDTAGVPTAVHHWPGQPVAEADWLYQLPRGLSLPVAQGSPLSDP